MIIQVLWVFRKSNKSGLGWDITILDAITNLEFKSDITAEPEAKCKRTVWGFYLDFLLMQCSKLSVT